MNVTTTESPVLSISEATLLHRQPRFGYIPLLAIFLSNLLSNTAVAKFIPLGSLRLSYDPIPILKPVSHPTPSHHHYPYAPPPPPLVSSEEVQHFYHHHHLPHINQNQIVNILDKKPTEIVVETDTEEATESSTEHQEYRDDDLEKPGIEEISDKSAKTLFKRGISSTKEVNSPPIGSEKIEVENVATGSSFENPSRIDGLEKPAMKEMSDKSVKIFLERETHRREDLNGRTYGQSSNVGHRFIPHPLRLLNQQQVVTLLYSKPTIQRSKKAYKYQVFKRDGFDNFEKTGKGLLKKMAVNDHKMIKNQYHHALSLRDRKNDTNQELQEVSMRSSIDQMQSNLGKAGEERSKETLLVKRMTVGEDSGTVSPGQYEFGPVPEVMKSGEVYESQMMSEPERNQTHFAVDDGSGVMTAVLDGNQAAVNIGIKLDGSGVGKIEDGVLLSSDVNSKDKNDTDTVGENSGQEVREYEIGLEKPVFEMMSGRSMRALVKRGTANRYRVRKNNKYLYQKRRRVPDYYYDSFEDITTSRYYKPRRRPTRPRRPIDSYEELYDANEDYDYDYPEVTKPNKNRRRPTTTTRPRRTNPRPTNRRRLQTTTSEYDDDDYAIEVVPRQGSTTITTGETDQPSSTTPGTTPFGPSTTRPTNATNTTGYGYGPSHGYEGISITYGPPTGGGHGLYGPPSTSYGHPQTHYGPPSTNYGTPNNGFAPSFHGYYQMPFSDWYNNEVSRTAIAKKAQDIIGLENIFN